MSLKDIFFVDFQISVNILWENVIKWKLVLDKFMLEFWYFNLAYDVFILMYLFPKF